MPLSKTNKQVVLASRPSGMPISSNFSIQHSSIPEPKDGEIQLQSLYISVDPYIRGRMDDRPSYMPPFQINQPLNGSVVAKVIQSKHPNFKEGEVVQGFLEWAQYSVSNGQQLQKVDPNLAPVSTSLGVLGIPGMTAYFGMLDIAKVQSKETVVVSSAAGAVGSVAVQIAKIKGARVIGIVGSDSKVDFLKNELSVDEALNYKNSDFFEKLKAACPSGVDVYFDNTGGDISNKVISIINKWGRVVLCGQISAYNLATPDASLSNMLRVMTQSVTIRGLLILDYQDRFGEALMQLAQWIKESKIKYHESILEGVESVPDAFLGLFRGDNIGKQLVKLSDV